MQNSKMTKLFLVVCLVIGGLFGKPIIQGLKSAVDNVNVTVSSVKVEIPEPSLENKTLVEGLAAIVTDEKDRVQLRDFYVTLAHVVKTEPGLIKTTGQFRNYNSLSGQLNFTGLDLKGKYNGLGEKVDEIFVNTLGRDNVELSSGKRQDLVDALTAIAWEFNR